MSRETIDTGDATLSCEVSDNEGPLVICAHGFPDCARSFRAQVPALTEAGYRVATPTMRAYHPSSVARSGRYDAAALGADLIAVANALSPGSPVVVVGHDWGAVAAYAAAQLRPDRIDRLITVAVPHLRVASVAWLRPSQLKKSWYMGLFQLPGVAERRVLQDDMALIDQLWRDWSPGWSPAQDEMRAIKDAIRPHLSDVLGYYRAIRRPRRDALESVMSKTTIPSMYVHGIDDGCIGVDATRGIARAYEAGLEVHHIEQAGHFAHLERPERFNALMLRFLSS